MKYYIHSCETTKQVEQGQAVVEIEPAITVASDKKNMFEQYR